MQGHDQVTRLTGQGDPGAIRRWDQGPAGYGHAHRLSQHVHGISRAHHGTRANARVGGLLKSGQFLLAHLALLYQPLGFD